MVDRLTIYPAKISLFGSLSKFLKANALLAKLTKEELENCVLRSTFNYISLKSIKTA
jgi:hypothetical protein